ncbi:LysM peptidoglycan-binding domain-containing protein [Rhodovulum sp. DZ06]|uniref:LysM peptidoglycan-binding domain-containing protein n=1 Tax=Rhodovulum sp. DZ06 TaxID=3425126 RepID=UPI003D32F213
MVLLLLLLGMIGGIVIAEATGRLGDWFGLPEDVFARMGLPSLHAPERAEVPGVQEAGQDAAPAPAAPAAAPAAAPVLTGDAPAAVAPTEPAETAAAPAGPTAPDAPRAPPPPAFDVVRVDVQGDAVLAGRARPGASVEVLLDGEVVAQVTATARGEFVAFAEVPSSGQTRKLRLRSMDAAGVGAEAPEEILILPDPGLVAAIPDAPGAEPVAAAAPGLGAPAAPTGGAALETAAPAVSQDPGAQAPGAQETGAQETAPAAAPLAAEDAAAEAPAPAEDAAAAQPEAETAAGHAAPAPGPARAAAQPPVLARSGPDGVELVQAPRAPSKTVTLDALSYDGDGAVVMAGRGAPGGFARIYADGTRQADVEIDATGAWKATLPGLTRPGVYTLRVDELSEGGRVTSRVESPFKRVADEALSLAEAGQVVVQPGANLWRIAQARYGEGTRYTVIYDANRERIRDPDLIYPGQIFELPEAETEAGAQTGAGGAAAD